jgi:hypothetical protein
MVYQYAGQDDQCKSNHRAAKEARHYQLGCGCRRHGINHKAVDCRMELWRSAAQEREMLSLSKIMRQQKLTITEYCPSRGHCKRISPLPYFLHHPTPLNNHPRRRQRYHRYTTLHSRPDLDMEQRYLQRCRRSQPKRLESSLPSYLRTQTERRYSRHARRLQ